MKNAQKNAGAIRALRKNSGLTQDQLAQKLGVSRVSVTHWENGEPPKRENALALAQLFGVGVSDLLDAPASEPEIEPRPNADLGSAFELRLPPGKIPIYGQASCGDDGRFEFNGTGAMGWAPMAPQLASVKNAYAIYVAGDSMEPRYYHGEILYVNPIRPVRSGDYVVVQLRPEVVGEAPYGFAKRFVSMDGKELTLEQFNPARELRFPRDRVLSVHLIVAVFRDS